MSNTKLHIKNYLNLWNREIQTNLFNFILYKFNEHTCEGRHLKGVVFLQYLISCKIKKIFEKIPKKFVKFCNLQQKLNMRKWKTKNDFFTCIFRRYQYLRINFTFYIENHAKLWGNKIKAPQKNIYERHCWKCTQKRKLKNVKTLVFDFVWTSFALNF